MPLYTEHLKLAKPTEDEFYNIAVPNRNMDVIDKHVRLLEEKNRLLEEEVAALRGKLANKADVKELQVSAVGVMDGFLDRGVPGDTPNCICTKDALNRVSFYFSVITSDYSNAAPNGTPVLELPVGFRPYRALPGTITVLSRDGSWSAGNAVVQANGRVDFYVSPGGGYLMYGQASFYTVQ